MAEVDAASLAGCTRLFETGAAVVAAAFLGENAVFALGEEALLFTTQDGYEQRVAVHEGGILDAATDGKRLVTGGDDGKVVVTESGGDWTTVAVDPKRRWIDRVAIAASGPIAWTAGKQVSVRLPRGEIRTTAIASSAGGLAFAPKGLRLAIAHYNGVTLWFPNASADPERLEWKGSHLAVIFSPDGKFLVTAMQEPTLHGWRLQDRQHLRMSGYMGKVRSMSFTADGDWLATGGSNQLILWPFTGKQGPIGRSPRTLAPVSALATVVACHPEQPVAAAGFEDGLVLLVRLDDGALIVARRPEESPVTALAWNPAGSLLAFGTGDGRAGIVQLT